MVTSISVSCGTSLRTKSRKPGRISDSTGDPGIPTPAAISVPPTGGSPSSSRRPVRGCECEGRCASPRPFRRSPRPRSRSGPPRYVGNNAPRGDLWEWRRGDRTGRRYVCRELGRGVRELLGYGGFGHRRFPEREAVASELPRTWRRSGRPRPPPARTSRRSAPRSRPLFQFAVTFLPRPSGGRRGVGPPFLCGQGGRGGEQGSPKSITRDGAARYGWSSRSTKTWTTTVAVFPDFSSRGCTCPCSASRALSSVRPWQEVPRKRRCIKKEENWQKGP
mmetsp:Transcript_19033/g.43338  ORF Transcript_19033/g.43338 Transcript_19033/m.43338 type:complete len:277 (-) Transcript_19033:39-869(-)